MIRIVPSLARWSLATLLAATLAVPVAEAQRRPSSGPTSREIIERRIRAAEARARRVPASSTRSGPAAVPTEQARAVAEDLRVLAQAMRWHDHLPEPRIRSLASLIVSESRRHEVPPALVLAIISRESGFKPAARSPVGATGLMQVMPFWPGQLGFRFGRDLTDEETNLRYGTWILRDALRGSGGDLRTALLRYNGCKPGTTGTPRCSRYPEEVRQRVERFARSTCQGRPWQGCVETPVRVTYDP